MAKFYECQPTGIYNRRDISSLGGEPYIPAQYSWPKCKICNMKMAFFLQMEARAEFRLPIRPNTVVSLFGCVQHMDFPHGPVDGDPQSLGRQETTEANGNYAAFVSDVNRCTRHSECPILVAESLNFTERVEISKEKKALDGGRYLPSGISAFKVGGAPHWPQVPLSFNCTCGSQMEFFFQIPEIYGFKTKSKTVKCEAQFDDYEYLLFFGNYVTVFVCPEVCSPKSLAVVTQR